MARHTYAFDLQSNVWGVGDWRTVDRDRYLEARTGYLRLYIVLVSLDNLIQENIIESNSI